MQSGQITLTDPERCFFHYRNELEAYKSELTDDAAVQHLVLILNYMHGTLSTEVERYKETMESSKDAPGLEHGILWMTFQPGTLIYHNRDGIHIIVRLKEMSLSIFGGILNAEQMVYDGESYGWYPTNLSIPWYNGYKPLDSLSRYPLPYHTMQKSIYAALLSRGQEYLNLRGIHHRVQREIADTLSPQRAQTAHSDMNHHEIHTITVRRPALNSYALLTDISVRRPSHH